MLVTGRPFARFLFSIVKLGGRSFRASRFVFRSTFFRGFKGRIPARPTSNSSISVIYHLGCVRTVTGPDTSTVTSS